MANKTLFKYIGATAVGVTLVVAPACTDTWDDHYDDRRRDPRYRKKKSPFEFLGDIFEG